MPALEEEAFYFLLQVGFPGWLHCVNLGATTIWERWNSVLDDGTMSGIMMNSLNHYAYGSVIEYLYKNVAGIRPLEPGFKKAQISPLINQKLGYVKAPYDSVYGTYRVEWKMKKDGRIHVKIEIPFGCTALVGFPFYPGEATGELTAGEYEFEYMPTEDLRRRYTNNKDIPLYQSQCALEERKGYVAACIGPEAAAEIAAEEYVPARPDQKFEALEDGMVFDLGGIHIDVCEFPGHTKGCMIFLVREEKILILGDACNNATFLFDDICSTVADYQKQIKKVSNLLEGRYDRVWIMHHLMEAPVSILTEMSDVCDEILAGEADNIPFSFMGKKAFIAKAANERFERRDGKFANLIYNPDRVR